MTGSLPGREMGLDARIQNGSETSEKARIHTSGSTDSVLPSLPTTRRSWKYPLIDRTVLDKLDLMQDFFAQEYGHSPERDTTPSQFRWPPLITRIPERPSRPLSIGPDSPAAICESAVHPRPCRFLLPLRVAEQESKARMHIMQLATLARRLNRTLVLPNVGKSKIGACFKWPFSTYYEATSISDPDAADSTLTVTLSGDADVGKESYVDLESFRAWMENNNRQRRDPLKSQLISIAPTLPPSGLRKEAIYANQHVAVHAYSTFGAWERGLPGCFASRFQPLKLETRPVFMSTTSPPKKDAQIIPIGDSIIDAFASISPGASREPPVLVVNWDMRYPVFPALPNSRSLQYSTRMHSLARRYAPKSPYLVIQWRMETVDLHLLHECAHALVDVLARILHDPALAENITTVWFASDYPYPVGSRSRSGARPPAVAAKSGTFRDFEVLHEEAVDILRKAFNEQGELRDWKLTDFIESVELDLKSQNELLQDPGVLGILDKLVSIEAELFVSGSARCSRKRYVSIELSFIRTLIGTALSRSKLSMRGIENGAELENLIGEMWLTYLASKNDE
ncbi:hypothetical protein CVT25_003048 [Psilocybe cyanescens]|uniref:Uncharacterized protein n=1 Tax=Psilocybe cyanescens TaxID=93625 RepID=A0A409WN98_PSICY|nr:hypothetical protein CVT25_003048 [Psilocybe cyanescens]